MIYRNIWLSEHVLNFSAKTKIKLMQKFFHKSKCNVYANKYMQNTVNIQSISVSWHHLWNSLLCFSNKGSSPSKEELIFDVFLEQPGPTWLLLVLFFENIVFSDTNILAQEFSLWGQYIFLWTAVFGICLTKCSEKFRAI